MGGAMITGCKGHLGVTTGTADRCAICGQVPIPSRPKPKARASERLDVVLPIVAALNAMPGVWAAENDRQRVKTPNGWIARQPLGEGSGDVIFSVNLNMRPIAETWSVARIGWLECKTDRTKTKRVDHAARDEQQAMWAEAMRRKGHFVAHGVVSVDQAMAAVERCRAGGYR